MPRENYRIGVPKQGTLKEIFNSDAKNITVLEISQTQNYSQIERHGIIEKILPN